MEDGMEMGRDESEKLKSVFDVLVIDPKYFNENEERRGEINKSVTAFVKGIDGVREGAEGLDLYKWKKVKDGLNDGTIRMAVTPPNYFAEEVDRHVAYGLFENKNGAGETSKILQVLIPSDFYLEGPSIDSGAWGTVVDKLTGMIIKYGNEVETDSELIRRNTLDGGYKGEGLERVMPGPKWVEIRKK
jgi:hypothetical protein